jgi:hypothetical protein
MLAMPLVQVTDEEANEFVVRLPVFGVAARVMAGLTALNWKAICGVEADAGFVPFFLHDVSAAVISNMVANPQSLNVFIEEFF